MVPISSDLKPLKTLIISIIASPPVAACGSAKYGYQYSQLRNCVRIFRIVSGGLSGNVYLGLSKLSTDFR